MSGSPDRPPGYVDTGPGIRTDPALGPVLAELIAREPLFHRPEFGTSEADFAAMVTDDYWEVGASGRRYSRAYVLGVLHERHREPVRDDPWETEDFYCRQLAPNLYQLSYTLHQGDRLTRRLTIWRQEQGGWQAVFHQGTLVQ